MGRAHRHGPPPAGLFAAGALLIGLTAASSCSGSKEAKPGHQPDPRGGSQPFFGTGYVVSEVPLDAEVLGLHRFRPSQRGAVEFQVSQGEGRRFRCLDGDPPKAIATYGSRTEQGSSSILLPLEALGGAAALKRVSGVEVDCYCPGEGAVAIKAVFLDGGGRVILASEEARVRRGEGLAPMKLPLPLGRDLSRTASVGIEFRGPAGVRSIAEIRLTSPVPGSELPALDAPLFIGRSSDVRRAAALLEGHPWEGRFAVAEGSYLRASLHAPELYRSADGALPWATLEVTSGGTKHVHTVQVPKDQTEGWYDVKLPLRGAPGDRGLGDDAVLRLSVSDNDPGSGAVILVGELSVLTPIVEPRTVLLITSDTHRADYVGTAKDSANVTTPVLDALARRGAYFEDCQTTTNITTPSHVAIMTGLHPRDTKIIDNSTGMLPEAATLAEAFQSAGFRTFAAVSIGHLTPHHSGLGQGFDRFLNPVMAEQRASIATEKLTDWLGDTEGEDVFLWLHVFDAHAPYRPLGEVVPPGGKEPRMEVTVDLLGGRAVPQWLRGVEVTSTDEIRGWYGEEVEAVDQFLQVLLDVPRVRSGWVALTSDHGENLGENGSWFEHAVLYQPVLQVPLVIAGPGVPPLRPRAQVQQFAVGRTLLDLAGVEAAFPGQNLLAAAESGELDEPRFGLSSYGSQASITVGKWLLILGLRTDTRHPSQPEYVAGRVRLYDRTLGLHSEEDFTDREPQVVKGLHRALTQWLGAQDHSSSLAEPLDLSKVTKRRLRELGYGGDSEPGAASWWDPDRVVDPRWRRYLDQE